MSSRARSDSYESSDSEQSNSIEADIADSIVSKYTVDLSRSNLEALELEEKRRVTVKDSNLAIINCNVTHKYPASIHMRHLSKKAPDGEPSSACARLFLARTAAASWTNPSAGEWQLLSDSFRQLKPEDQQLVEGTPHFRKLIHLVSQELCPGPNIEGIFQAKLLDPGDENVYHERTIKKVKTSAVLARIARMSAGSAINDSSIDEQHLMASGEGTGSDADGLTLAGGAAASAGDPSCSTEDIYDFPDPSDPMDSHASSIGIGPTGGVPPSTVLREAQATSLADHAPTYFDYTLPGKVPDHTRAFSYINESRSY